MQDTIKELGQVIEAYAQKITSLPDDEFSAKPDSKKWSKKEVLGHLIDSAHNNLRRFICGQYESAPPKIVYDQDHWVISNNYSSMDSEELILCWRLINRRIIAVLSQMPTSNYAKLCDTGKNETQLHSIEWLAEDYVKHMKHHLNQIIPHSFNIIYP
jgi:uncharacterized damage-inducible protein DinB